jgi:hypothetical protein
MRSVARVVLAIALLALVLLVVALVALNGDVPTRPIQLGVLDLPPLPIGTLLAGALGSGFLVGVLLAVPGRLRTRSRHSALRKEAAALEEEVRRLRALPLEGAGG